MTLAESRGPSRDASWRPAPPPPPLSPAAAVAARRTRTAVLLNVAAIVERADEGILPAVRVAA